MDGLTESDECGKMKAASTGGEILAAVALIKRGDCFLVGRRRSEGDLPGRDEFPGGKCQPGEATEQCVVRECREETGLGVVVESRRKEVTYAYPHGRVRLTFFDCKIADDAEPKPPFRWVPGSELSEMNFPEANWSIVAELAQEG